MPIFRHQNPTGSPNAMNPAQQAQVAAMQQNMMNQSGQNPPGPPPGAQTPGQNPAQMAAMYQQGVQPPPPGVQPQQPGGMVGVYPDGMGGQVMPSMPHVGIPHRQAFDPSQAYPHGMPQMVR